MQTGDIGSMMNQFKEQKNITGEGITDASKIVSEAQDTIEKAQQAPQKPADEEKVQQESTDAAPDNSNVQLNSDVKIVHRPELLAIETSTETQKLLDEANEVLDEDPKTKKVVLAPKPVIKEAARK